MGSDETEDRALEQRNGTSNMTCCSPMMDTDLMSDNAVEMSISSESMLMSSSGIDHPLCSSGWNTMISGNLPQIQFAHPAVLENGTTGSSWDFVRFTSDSGLVDRIPKIPSFGSGVFSEMVSSFGHIDESGRHSNLPQNQGAGIQRASIDNTHSQKHGLNSEQGVLGALPNAKRKRKVSMGVSCKNLQVAQQAEQAGHGSEFPKADEEKNIGSDSCSNRAVKKQTKDNSNGAATSKENYVLVRAKRGQATNSHSLAERVRRERISERMRLLQELVPGCDKVTGKAVMLDEIINYVQSLQQQVEFLSMKLATINSELNVDIERILSKDILHRHGKNATASEIYPELSSHHALAGLPQGTINSLPDTAPPLPQNLWNNVLENILQTGFHFDPSISSLQENGFVANGAVEFAQKIGDSCFL